jgi:hypothetical protein
MDLPLALLIFAIGFAVGYGVREISHVSATAAAASTTRANQVATTQLSFAHPKGAAAMRLNGDPSNRRWSRGGDRWSVATKSIKPPPWCSYLGTRVASLYS